jgi:LmbE family N-acetylglucosaminyl deacetylase
MTSRLTALAVSGVLLSATGLAQLRPKPVAESPGREALGLALRRLGTVGTVMMSTAHPDDENNALLAKLRWGSGLRTVLVSATRGDGGQNEIGPELFDALAVLRTEELLAAHRFDGAEQYFTRAVDFGYSFSIEETFERWGKDEIVGDYVRLIREIRPDVIIGFVWGGTGGGQHHQASTRITAEAFRAAADPARYPEQIKEGRRPWQARKFYYSAGFGRSAQSPPPDPRRLSMDLNEFDPLLGRTYATVGAEARSMHKCQGISQLLPLGGPVVREYYLHDAAGGEGWPNASLMDGVDLSLKGLTRFAPGAPQPLALMLESVESSARQAQRAFESGAAEDVVDPLLSGFAALRKLREALPGVGLDPASRDEIDHRLADEARDFEHALVVAHGLRVDVVADDGLVVPGQRVKVSVRVTGHSPRDVQVKAVGLTGLDAPATSCNAGVSRNGVSYACDVEASVPTDAALTSPYWRSRPDAARYDFATGVPFGRPFAPSPFRGEITLGFGAGEIQLNVPVQHRSDRDIFSGEKRSELMVVPSLSLRVSPETIIVPLAATPTGGRGRGSDGAGAREVRVDVVNGARGPAAGFVSLRAPSGWSVSPSEMPVSLAREDEAISVKFRIAPGNGTKPGHFAVRATARSEKGTFDRGYQAIEYPHTTRRHVIHEAQAAMHVLDIRSLDGLRVGYVMGVGDDVPAAIAQLGAQVTLLGRDELAWGDFTSFNTIVTGVRAYERRADLRAYNHRLLEYVAEGGTMIVQYNKFEFNDAQYGPWPAKVSADRVTDERAPVRLLVPDHPAFTTPNRMSDRTWEGWVQERGLYFLGERDARYVDLLETEDPFPNNAGLKRGALVEARHGKGRWLYVGLGLWRQLPAGTDGAYTLLANLLSLGRSSAGTAAAR